MNAGRRPESKELIALPVRFFDCAQDDSKIKISRPCRSHGAAFGCGLLYVAYRMSPVGCQVPNARCRMPNVACQMPTYLLTGRLTGRLADRPAD